MRRVGAAAWVEPTILILRLRVLATASSTTNLVHSKNKKQQQPHSPQAPSRIKFCQWDTLACINCAAPASSSSPHPPQQEEDTVSLSADTFVAAAANTTPVRGNTTTTTANHRSKKLGPVLLELRRLELVVPPTDSSSSDDDAPPPSLIRTTTVCQSRGNPSLGNSISSTCLDVRMDGTGASSSLPRCATGLTTGALCVHSFAQGGRRRP